MDNPEVQNKVDKYDIDAAIADMSNIISDTADLMMRIKRVKFNYLMQTCEMYTRLDYPSIMMDVCEKEVRQMVPTPKNVRAGQY